MQSYTFWSNTRFHFREMLKREPLAAVFFIITLPLGAFLPLLNARLPKLVLQGLEEGWELSVYLERLIALILLLVAANAAKTGLDNYLHIMNGPFEDIYNQQLLDKRLAVDFETAESKEFNEQAYAVYDSLYRNKAEMKDSFLIWQRFLIALASAALYGSILWLQSPFYLRPGPASHRYRLLPAEKGPCFRPENASSGSGPGPQDGLRGAEGH